MKFHNIGKNPRDHVFHLYQAKTFWKVFTASHGNQAATGFSPLLCSVCQPTAIELLLREPRLAKIPSSDSTVDLHFNPDCTLEYCIIFLKSIISLNICKELSHSLVVAIFIVTHDYQYVQITFDS